MSRGFTHRLLTFCLFIFPTIFPFQAEALEIKVIGQVESLYQNRVSLRILDVPGDASQTSPLKIGSRVSFNLPKADRSRQKRQIEFGSVIEADLDGNVATEYSAKQDTETPLKDDAVLASQPVLIWTAKRTDRVKNPRKYLSDPDEKESKDKRGKRKGKKSKEPPQIWTQEETVKGKVFVKNQRIFIKEESLKPRDLGLDVTEKEWMDKLLPYEGRTVVAFGKTHRVSISSGTIELKNLIKIYPK